MTQSQYNFIKVGQLLCVFSLVNLLFTVPIVLCMLYICMYAWPILFSKQIFELE